MVLMPMTTMTMNEFAPAPAADAANAASCSRAFFSVPLDHRVNCREMEVTGVLLAGARKAGRRSRGEMHEEGMGDEVSGAYGYIPNCLLFR